MPAAAPVSGAADHAAADSSSHTAEEAQQQDFTPQGAGTGAAGEEQNFGIYVRGLPDGITEAQLREKFGSYGAIKPGSGSVSLKHSGKWGMVAWIDYTSKEAVTAAIADGKNIEINGAKPAVLRKNTDLYNAQQGGGVPGRGMQRKSSSGSFERRGGGAGGRGDGGRGGGMYRGADGRGVGRGDGGRGMGDRRPGSGMGRGGGGRGMADRPRPMGDKPMNGPSSQAGTA